MVNAFCTENSDIALKSSDKVVFCGQVEPSAKNVEFYPMWRGTRQKRIYLPSMCDETVFDEVCDAVLTDGSDVYVRAAYDLYESGVIESKYKLSPIMLLHKMGILSSCTIVGGVCLDNDDLDLMAQEGVALVITPTASAGYGHGYPPICAAVKRGIRVGVGTFDGKYNKTHDIRAELEFLRLTANAEMRREDVLSEDAVRKISLFM